MTIGNYTVYQKKDKAGTWIGRVIIGYKNTTPIRKSVSGKTKKEAQEKTLALRDQVLRGAVSTTSKATVFEYGLYFIREVKAGQVSPKTLGGYEETLRTYIAP